MKLKTSTVVLGGLLAVSLVGNVWQGLSAVGGGVGRFYTDMYREQEIQSLRTFGERVAAGEAPRAVLVELSGPVSEEKGWLDNQTIRAKFDGERLVKLCGSKSVEPDTCSEAAK
ncbi:MAG: hypothetical protein ACK4RV_10870 [Caulobacter sp.]